MLFWLTITFLNPRSVIEKFIRLFTTSQFFMHASREMVSPSSQASFLLGKIFLFWVILDQLNDIFEKPAKISINSIFRDIPGH